MSNTHTLAKVRFARPDERMFFATLRQRVDAYFIDNHISSHANVNMVVKTISLFSIYILPFIILLTIPVSTPVYLLLWAIMGFGVAGIGMGVMHDANHGSYTANQRLNDVMGYSLNLLGASIFNWKNQHNVLHHTYTNITHMDEDIDDKQVLRFSPHTKLKGVHRYQWIFAFVIYGITSFYWVTVKDFMQFARHDRKGLIPLSAAQKRIAMAKIIVLKIVYFSVMLGLPVWLGGYSLLTTFAGFFLMHFIAGFVLTVVFQLAHTVEGTQHPMPDANGNIENEWAIHQMNTTVNFSPKSHILNWYVGGLNYQVEHHLFPRICHVHYPEIAPIVQQTAKEFGVPYLVNPTFLQAFRSHVATLRRFGTVPSIDDVME